MAKLPTGFWSRGTKLVGMASKLAVSELSSRMKTWEDEATKVKSRMEMAQSLVKTLSELKGASMKMGQLLSMDLGNYLPPEVVKVLETLHHQSSFLPYSTIKEILEQELKEKLSDLKDISETPIAAASIGQVHSATLDGRKVVIKIQYPGVAESIPSDMKMLELILKNLSFLQGKEVDLKPFFEEVADVLLRETDYLYEARMLANYHALFTPKEYVVPQVFSAYSTSKVLTMDFIEGKPLMDWIKTSLLGERQKVAHKLMNLYLQEFFAQGLVQTDPNPGNFMMTSKNQIALLDFGAVKEYDEAFIQIYRQILIASYQQDREKILSLSESIQFIDPRESEDTKRVYLEMMELLSAPFRQEEPFDFTDRSFFEASKDLSWELSRKCKYSAPPKDLLFLHRKLVGIFMLIRKLDVKLKLKDYWHMVENPTP